MLAPIISLFLIAGTNSFLVSRVGNAYRSVGLKAAEGEMPAGHPVAAVEEKEEYSFVNVEMKKYAMKAHGPMRQVKSPARKAEDEVKKTLAEAAMKAAMLLNPQVQQINWQPERINYVQFLVDSLYVYETMESIAEEYEMLAPFRVNGLNRVAALKEDMQWLSATYPSLVIPPPGPHGPGYSGHLRDLARDSMPNPLTHYPLTP
mmetsp:Transcript_14878/g.14276  ORF Transcript_14878/g.14276 Transcript_14878/m.14276 type:complete len:204 (-) Transcript_14878:42-653(-)